MIKEEKRPKFNEQNSNKHTLKMSETFLQKRLAVRSLA